MKLTRRSFLATTAAVSAGAAFAQKNSSIPVGLEMYSVRKALMTDLMGTIAAVCDMGYQDVEFFSPYYQWTEQQAKDLASLLNAGALPVELTRQSVRTVSPTLGSESLKAGMRPGNPEYGADDPSNYGQLTTADGVRRTVPTLPGVYQQYYAGIAASETVTVSATTFWPPAPTILKLTVRCFWSGLVMSTVSSRYPKFTNGPKASVISPWT